MNTKTGKTIPIFYACDDNFIKFAAISIKSILENSDKNRFYSFHILITDLSPQNRKAVLSVKQSNCEIIFDDVTEYLKKLTKDLPIRDYYSKTTYYRLFIADMFPQLEKVIYIDSDTIVKKDISALYDIDLKDNYVGAVSERVMAEEDVFGTYVEQCVGIDRYAYFNAGVLLINCAAFRDNGILSRFGDLLSDYDFVVTQDEDYLNLLCKDRVLLLNGKWNAEIFRGIPVEEEEVAIFHYIMTSKPWHYRDCAYGAYFWKYAAMTCFYDQVVAICDAYTDEERLRDELCGQNLAALAVKETQREDNYLKTQRKNQDAERVKVLQKIDQLERTGKFDIDVEDDPPTKPLPDKVDYLRKNLIGKLKAKHAFHLARKFLNGAIEKKQFIIGAMEGVENLTSVEGGAIITCNHFNALDSFAMQMVYEKTDTKKHRFYRVIREGNYTSFGGFYGYLMRNCYTLPLGSDIKHMKMFTQAVSQILKDNGFVLVYAEQSMWWNYRKPKPLKKGAFSLAAINNVPVVPCFITMRDSGVKGDDGFFVQEYHIHIGKPIYPDKDLSVAKNTARMMETNARVWKEIYENFYGIPLRYKTENMPAALAAKGAKS